MVARDEVGRVLAGRYELTERAGEGGMATVWRGLVRGAAGFYRPIAVKRIRQNIARDPEFVRMFVEEARVSADLDHPNVVQIHDFGRDEDGQFFLVMEWIEGVDLRRWSMSYRSAGWHAPWHLVAAMAIEALTGLQAAHTRVDPWGKNAPCYHRDVTPGNVLIGRHGMVKLGDFGLARAMDRARITRPNVLKGKVSYLAPELIEDQEASVQSDIFSLGVVLWEVLSGRHPFRGPSDLETIRAIAEADAPPLVAHRPDVPGDLAGIVHRALAKHPSERWTSARDMARALATLLRTVAEPTDATVLSESVRLARERLGLPAHSIPPPRAGSIPPPLPPSRMSGAGE